MSILGSFMFWSMLITELKQMRGCKNIRLPYDELVMALILTCLVTCFHRKVLNLTAGLVSLMFMITKKTLNQILISSKNRLN